MPCGKIENKELPEDKNPVTCAVKEASPFMEEKAGRVGTEMHYDSTGGRSPERRGENLRVKTYSSRGGSGPVVGGETSAEALTLNLAGQPRSINVITLESFNKSKRGLGETS